MQNANYILIGISVLTVACIYLYYLHFTKEDSKSTNAYLDGKIDDIDYVNKNLSEDMLKVKKLVTYNTSNIEMMKKTLSNMVLNEKVATQYNNMENTSELDNVYQEDLEEQELVDNNNVDLNVGNLNGETDNNMDAADDADDDDEDDEDTDVSDYEVDDIDCEDTNDEINLELQAKLDNENNDMSDIDIDSDIVLDLNEDDLDLTEADIEKINKLDNNTTTEFTENTETTEITQTTQSTQQLPVTDLDNLSDLGDGDLLNEINQMKMESDNTEAIRIKPADKPSQIDELTTSTIKELKVIAKNLGISVRGNKDNLIERIIERTQKTNKLDNFAY